MTRDGSSGRRRRNPSASASGRPTGSSSARGTLSRDLIVERAIEFIDRDGVTALTMRRLGEDLGVEAMSLYGHVNGREDLLEGVVATLVAGIDLRPTPPLGPQDGWQAFLQWTAHSVRAVALAHPRIFPLIATRHPAAPWLRPPLRSLRVVEDFLAGLIDRGFTPAQAVAIYRSFTSFLLGHLLLETATLGADTAPAEVPLNEGAAEQGGHDAELDVARFPTVLGLRQEMAHMDAQAEFEQALEGILDLIDLRVSQ